MVGLREARGGIERKQRSFIGEPRVGPEPTVWNCRVNGLCTNAQTYSYEGTCEFGVSRCWRQWDSGHRIWCLVELFRSAWHIQASTKSLWKYSGRCGTLAREENVERNGAALLSRLISSAERARQNRGRFTAKCHNFFLSFFLSLLADFRTILFSDVSVYLFIFF